MISSLVLARGRDQPGEPTKEREGLEEDVRVTVAPALAHLESDPSVGEGLQLGVGERRPGGVTAEPLSPGAVSRLDPNPRVHAEVMRCSP